MEPDSDGEIFTDARHPFNGRREQGSHHGLEDDEDDKFMRMALRLAELAHREGEVPVRDVKHGRGMAC